jgi:hypothetical protein
MQMWDDRHNWHQSFDLLAFYAGKIKKRFSNGTFWAERLDDETILPIAHIMELAFRMNNLVIMKKPDDATQKLIKAHLEKTRLETIINILVGKRDSSVWQGSYIFEFKVEQMLPNQIDGRGRRWELALLQIIDRTERTQFKLG